jgi:outer membrane protein OmpA-like peptidoglycan-associated protein
MRNAGRIMVLATAVAALAACTHPDGSTNRTGTGAAIGAAAGGLVGNLIGDSTAATVAGAALGGIAGTAIGADLDRQQQELQQSLGGSGASVVNTGNQLVVTLPESITFDTGSATVHPDYVDEIALVARSLRQNPNSTILVIGHTDDVGSTEFNQGLSERRAEAVASILTSNGVEGWRVNTVGRGYSQPVASNDTPGGRAQNRRVEIIITPVAGAA